MLGSLFRSFRKAGIGAETRNLLMKNYNFNADPKALSNCAQEMGEFFNSHELAIYYLSGQISLMKPDHPNAEQVIKKYVRVAKQAYAVGLATNEQALKYLTKAAFEKFGIDTDSIAPSPY